MLTEYEEDMEQINNLTGMLYATVCFGEGEEPALDKLDDLFVQGGRLINNNPDSPLIMDAEGFVERVKDMIAGGKLKSFNEREINSVTELFGKIAHRFSTYESRFDPQQTEPFSVGINSIQMVKIKGKWLISSLVWNDRTSGMPVPQKYMPE